MTFAWPWVLISLAVLPLLIALYVWWQRRRRRYAVDFASLSLLRDVIPRRSKLKQHLPFGLLLAALACLAVASARPQAVVQVPLSRTSIVLALDVSRSMCSIDVSPNRLSVAQDAARQFVETQADGTQLGIVTFGGSAAINVSPTDDKEQLDSALETLTTSLGTAIGSATLKSIDAIAATNPAVTQVGEDLIVREDNDPVPDIIVLLTDGANSAGVDPILAAEEAAARGVRVFTIGFGTNEIADMVCTIEQLGSDAFDPEFGMRFRGGGFSERELEDLRPFLVLDEVTLTAIADMTGGEYYRAEDASALTEIFQSLPTRIELQEEEREIGNWFVALGALLASLAMGLSILWNRNP
jgi:Ca-activated chloride channel family protein